MEFRVTLYFADGTSELIKVQGKDLKAVSDKVGKMIKDGDVHNANGGHYHWNYNMALVKTFHVSQN
ncbi:hypothetical protein [Lederbergia lenta]|uniref:hypothetical protein n=1 Tax=Lederbergia lenta TaxID=1467 RepID=UPI00203FEEFB|nr:hypothetical protein [Lederbergia lenta]MCM3110671.1 hypothetical protein [Lederbergia lenta]